MQNLSIRSLDREISEMSTEMINLAGPRVPGDNNSSDSSEASGATRRTRGISGSFFNYVEHQIPAPEEYESGSVTSNSEYSSDEDVIDLNQIPTIDTGATEQEITRTERTDVVVRIFDPDGQIQEANL